MGKRAHLWTAGVVGLFVVLAVGSAPNEDAASTEAPAPGTTVEALPDPPPVATVALADPDVFAIPEPASSAETLLPLAGVRLRLPPGARVSESGRFSSGPQAGPYIGIVLPGGRDVQIDAMDADVEWSRGDADRRRGLGELGVLHTDPGELVTQPHGVNGCSVSVCHAVGGSTLCAVTGGRSVAGVEGTTYPVLRDCGVLVAIVRSLEPL